MAEGEEPVLLEIYQKVYRNSSVNGFVMDVFDDDEGLVPSELTGYSLQIEHRTGSRSGKLLVKLIGLVSAEQTNRVTFPGFDAVFPQGKVYWDLLLISPGEKKTIIPGREYSVIQNVTQGA